MENKQDILRSFIAPDDHKIDYLKNVMRMDKFMLASDAVHMCYCHEPEKTTLPKAPDSVISVLLDYESALRGKIFDIQIPCANAIQHPERARPTIVNINGSLYNAEKLQKALRHFPKMLFNQHIKAQNTDYKVLVGSDSEFTYILMPLGNDESIADYTIDNQTGYWRPAKTQKMH